MGTFSSPSTTIMSGLIKIQFKELKEEGESEGVLATIDLAVLNQFVIKTFPEGLTDDDHAHVEKIKSGDKEYEKNDWNAHSVTYDLVKRIWEEGQKDIYGDLRLHGQPITVWLALYWRPGQLPHSGFGDLFTEMHA